ncbi:retropepsin-like aspartic protease [Kaistella sp. PBT33-4]|uniref:retropepsin-like aspartic protease family protein n=1 Tax=Kaistella sp. PBT33-4 TaxID=3032000 RepID=UPI0023D81B7B|nr:retropepsin-like aspartic protease [Kaistella sp. PBT33-4]MDF0718592.1 retropepsin-like aspartic protease [Kaistella sp. PBT33-4]
MKKGSSGTPVITNSVVTSPEHASVRISDPVALAPAAQTGLEAPQENVVQMERENGVNFVWIELNGIPLRFIFDTGASSIFISPAEALVLVKQGTLNEEDLIGEEQYQDATGDVSVGTVINLKEVKIGNRILRNVKASVSDNIESPLLLGQSALEQFGTIEIDNRNSRIILR